MISFPVTSEYASVNESLNAVIISGVATKQKKNYPAKINKIKKNNF